MSSPLHGPPNLDHPSSDSCLILFSYHHICILCVVFSSWSRSRAHKRFTRHSASQREKCSLSWAHGSLPCFTDNFVVVLAVPHICVTDCARVERVLGWQTHSLCFHMLNSAHRPCFDCSSRVVDTRPRSRGRTCLYTYTWLHLLCVVVVRAGFVACIYSRGRCLRRPGSVAGMDGTGSRFSALHAHATPCRHCGGWFSYGEGRSPFFKDNANLWDYETNQLTTLGEACSQESSTLPSAECGAGKVYQM